MPKTKKKTPLQQIDKKTQPFVTLNRGQRGGKPESRIVLTVDSSHDLHMFRIRGLAYTKNLARELSGVYEVTHVDCLTGRATLRSVKTGRHISGIRYIVGTVRFVCTCEEHHIARTSFVLFPGGAMLAGCTFFNRKETAEALKLVGEHLGYEFSD